MNPVYTKRQRLLARIGAILFILSVLFAAISGLTNTAFAAEENTLECDLTIRSTTGGVPDNTSEAYTIQTGDTVQFELNITNTIRPQAITIVNTTGTQFQQIDNMAAIDRNNNPIPWEYNNSLPIDNRIEINATGLPEDTCKINVTYTCSVLESGALSTNGINGQILYMDNNVTHIVKSERLYGLNFQISVIDSSTHTNVNTDNYLTTGSYSLYTSSDATHPLHFSNTGDIYKIIPEWDGRGKNYIEIKNTGTANIQGLASGVYYLKQITPPDNYEDYKDIIEIQLYAVKSGDNVSSRIKVLNNADVQLQPISTQVSKNTLTLDYAGTYSTMRHIQTILVQNTLPILGLMLLGVGIATMALKNKATENVKN